MSDRSIPQRELRNNIARILREAEHGAEFTITVRGRPVARLGPVEEGRRRVNLPAGVARAMLAATPVDPGFAVEIARMRELEEPVDEPWPSH